MKKVITGFAKSPNALVLGISLILLIARMLFVSFGPLDLAPDEAQYWDWTRYLDWSYTTKPPLTTWLIMLSTGVLGSTYLGVRFFALLGQILVPLLGYAIVKQATPGTHKQDAALWAFFLLTFAPLIAGGGLIMSPDVPSLVLWLAALLVVVRMNVEDAPKWRSFIGLGILVGLAGLAKPTAALFYPLLGLYFFFYKREWLLKPQVYASGLVALALQFPVFYWNATNDWAMFAHVGDQANSDARWGGFASFLEFLGSQAGVLGPITFLVLLWVWAGAYRNIKQPKVMALWIFSALIFLLFSFASLQGKVQANWPILGMVTGVVFMAMFLPYAAKWVKVLLIAGFILNATVTIAAHDTFILRSLGVPLKVKNDPTKPMLGWRGLGQQVGAMLEEFPNATILTTRYQTTAGLAFHIAQQPMVRYVNPGYRRENHYDHVTYPTSSRGPVLYVNEGGNLPERVKDMFVDCRKLADLNAMRQQVSLRTASVYLCQ